MGRSCLDVPAAAIAKTSEKFMTMNLKPTTVTLFRIVFGFVLAWMSQAMANVTITAASGGGSLSADTAANAPVPGWTTLGPITLIEGGTTKGDFTAGSDVTLILKAPA